MQVVIIIALVLIFFIVMGIKNTLDSRYSEIMTKLDQLATKLNKLGESEKKEKSLPGAAKPQPVEKVFEQKEPEPVIPSNITKPVPEKKSEIIKESQPIIKEQTPSRENIPVFTSVQGAKKESPAPARPGFFERNPDLEKFIGENLANKIGIAILVLGIGFFVKYAIDKEWIGVYGRVLIGIFCGGVLVALAHWLRKSFVSFSSVLVGGGIAVLYLTISIAFHEYQIIGQAAAFLIMVFITAFTILLSIAYNRIELAILAILGGFGSPFMVSTGEGNYVVLFTYILILDVGMVVLAYFKKWNPVNIIAYAFTIILFGSWLTLRYDGLLPMLGGALTFSTMFYLVFFAMTVVNNLKVRTKFGPIEFSMLLSNTFLYYAAGMFILNNPVGDVYKGLFTACIGVFNFVFAFLLFRSKQVDRNLVFLLIGLVLTFISLAAPIQLEGNYITLFWSAEAVLLLWLSQQSGIKLMKLASVVVIFLMIVSLLMDWNNIYLENGSEQLRIILNKGYITTFVAIASVFSYYHLLKFEKGEYTQYVGPARGTLTLAGAIVLYMWNYLELDHQLNYFAEPGAIPVIIGSYNMFFILVIVLMEGRLMLQETMKQLFAGWGIIAAMAYLFLYHADIVWSRNAYLDGTESFLGFGFHYLLVMLLVAITTWSVNRFRRLKDFNSSTFNIYAWFFVFFFLFLASAELDHTVLLTLSSTSEDSYHLISQNHKIGYPILWGISSFILIAIGLRRKNRHLRIISLTLFLVTLLKLFLIDIRGISEGGKIAAFISLGVLLLIVSFMYQRLKKFLMSDEDAVPAGQNETRS
jgi:uncharacterized membrane protein